LPFDKDLDEFFGISDFFDPKFLRRLELQLNEIMEAAKRGKIKGTWEIKEFDQPGTKGFAILGRFGTDESLEPIEPLRPSKRKPLPENPFEIPNNERNETCEPLTDVFEEENAIKIYVELPGEEKENIKLHITEKTVEIKAKNFYKMIDLPKRHIASESISSEYKNGVLEITIPKSKEMRWEDKGKAKMV
jgi:HSP20 family molecular chaperone IbpA